MMFFFIRLKKQNTKDHLGFVSNLLHGTNTFMVHGQGFLSNQNEKESLKVDPLKIMAGGQRKGEKP